MEELRNWAGNYRYSTGELLVPESVEQIQELAASGSRFKTLGTRHSFNGIADSDAKLISLQKLNRVLELDRASNTVTVEAGIRYGELCRYLHEHGYALRNLASLPHITVAGACATGTHGSGDRNGNLATELRALEAVRADGGLAVFTRDGQGAGGIEAAAVHLGAIGVVTKLTLDIVPAYEVRQYVYENLPLHRLRDELDAIFASAYSVSLFTDWRQPSFNQVWLKHRTDEPGAERPDGDFYGAARAAERLHPVPGQPTANCSEQLGIPGAWHERLPHFRMEFTPSAGEELQSEYFVARQDAYEALSAIERIRDRIAPLLYVSEVRSIAADALWMSPCYKRDSIAIHFTWKPNEDAVRQVLPLIESALAPFAARPHWGKLFAMPPVQLHTLYEKLPDFRRLLLDVDPRGQFRNEYLDHYLMGNA